VLAVGDGTVVVVPTPAGARTYDATAVLAPGAEVELAATAGAATEQSVELADGTALPRIVSGQSFWFAWYGAHPDTDWWPR
jgi:hypothetical protein